VDFEGGRFPPVWLRDNCGCLRCRDAATGQKLFGITDLPAALDLASVEEDANAIRVVFAPDGHESIFTRAWLAEHALAGTGTSDGRTEADKVLWRAADLAGRLPEAGWRQYLDDPRCRAACLEHVLRLGFVLLHEVPAEPGNVLRVVETFGYVRE
jgi:gamma-butyrobetaine dioxygenase